MLKLYFLKVFYFSPFCELFGEWDNSTSHICAMSSLSRGAPPLQHAGILLHAHRESQVCYQSASGVRLERSGLKQKLEEQHELLAVVISQTFTKQLNLGVQTGIFVLVILV